MTSPAPAETPRKCFRGDCKSCSGMDVITGGPCLCPCHPTLVQRLRGFALQSDCLEGAARIESLERQLAEKQAEAKHYKFAADSCASFSAVVIAERDALQAALTAERQRAEGLEKLITDHNNACQDLCGRGDQEAVRCKYRPYFETSGRRCPECPTHNIIDFVPSDAALAAGQEEGK